MGGVFITANRFGVYKDKKVLVTGHTGFKGSWLTLWLKHLGAEVVGYSLDPPSEPNLFHVLRLDEKIDHLYGDVLNFGHLSAVFDELQPEFVFHLAAQPIVRRSYKEPKLTFETNIMGTLNVLECLRNHACTKVCVIVTSDKCYENQGYDYVYRENDCLGGNDPYSSSKACAELITKAYRKSIFIGRFPAVSSARAGNVIGGGDWGEDRLVPDCVRALSTGNPIVLRNPTMIRPWQYVLDPLSGYLRLGATIHTVGNELGAFNFGSYSRETVGDIVRRIIKQWGEGRYETDTSPQPREEHSLMLNTEKAKMLLGWRPVYNINETVMRTVEWYKRFYAGEDMYDYSIREIEAYEKSR